MARGKQVDVLAKLVDLKEKYMFVDDTKYLSGLEKLIAQESAELMKQGLFEYKGEFWGILETRNYMQLLFDKCIYLKEVGRLRMAVEIAEEMMELCESDSLGVRFHLMSLYAYFEDDKILDLYKKFNYGLFEKFPMAIYYYKIGDEKKYKDLMKKIKKDFPNINENIAEILENYELYMDQSSFRIGDFTEVVMMVNFNYYLLLGMGYFTSIL